MTCAMLEFKRSTFVAICLLALNACGSNDSVVIERPYEPAQVSSYDLTTFINEWNKTNGVPESEMAVLQDLQARHDSQFDWRGFWMAFVDSKIQGPKNEKTWKRLMDPAFPKCTPQTRDAFVLLAASDLSSYVFAPGYSAIHLNLLLTEQAALSSCTPAPSETSLRNLILRLVKDPIIFKSDSEFQNQRDRLLSQLLAFISKDGFQNADLQQGFRKYLEVQLARQALLSSNLADLLEQYDRQEKILGMSGLSLLDDLLLTQGSWQGSSLRSLAQRLGSERVMNIIARNRQREDFLRLSETDQRDFLLGVYDLLKSLSPISQLDYLGTLLRYLEIADVSSLKSFHLHDFDSYLGVMLAGVDAKERSQYLRELTSRPLNENFKLWVRSHFDPKQVSASVSFNKSTSIFDDILLRRIAARHSLSANQSLREGLRSICDYYNQVWGYRTRTVPNLSAVNFSQDRGCLNIKDTAGKFVLPTASIISPDLIILSNGGVLDVEVEGDLIYGWFDSSAGILQVKASVPATLPPEEIHRGILFPVIVGFQKSDSSFQFMPFHFDLQRPQPAIDPAMAHPQSEIPQSLSAGDISLKVSGRALFSVLSGHGDQGQAGWAPAFGGVGDTSSPLKVNLELLEKLKPDLEKLLGHRFVFKPYGTRQDWREFLKLTQLNEARDKNRFVYLDRVLMEELLEDSDRKEYQATLHAILNEAGEKNLKEFCIKLQNDPAYQRLKRLDGQIAQGDCDLVFAHEELGRIVFVRLAEAIGENQWDERFDLKESFSLPSQPQGLPGHAQRSGDGGNIHIRASQILVLSSSQAGERFRYPNSWNAAERDGDHGLDGVISVQEE